MNTNPFKSIGFVLLIGLLALAVMPLAAQDEGPPPRTGLRPDAPPYAIRGPHPVGTMEMVIDPDGDRPLPVTVWYPAVSDAPEGPHTYVVETPPAAFEGQALPEALPNVSSGPYPLAIWSHGHLVNRYFALFLTEHLASYGFVVIAVDHTGDTIANLDDEESFIRSHATRPNDITRVIDFAENATAVGGELETLIDLEHVAVMGQSSGAFTTFLAAGAQRDFGALNAYCVDNPDDFFVCGQLKGQEETLAALVGLDEVPEGLWPSVGDSRVDAIVPMAPGNAVAFGPRGLAAIQVPALVMIGTLDVYLPYDSFGPPTYEAISGEPKALVTFQGGSHMLFTNACSASPWMIEAGWWFFCSEPIWDLDRSHDLTNHFVTAFLLDVLKGDAEAHAALAPDAVSFPGITYEAEGF
jgi:predicted dienelactone hydrolase